MDDDTQVRRYAGRTPDESWGLYLADAEQAALGGFYPVSQEWTGGADLTVRYGRVQTVYPTASIVGGPAPGPGGPDAAARTRPTRSSKRKWLLGGAVVVGILIFGASLPDPEATPSPSPGPTFSARSGASPVAPATARALAPSPSTPPSEEPTLTPTPTPTAVFVPSPSPRLTTPPPTPTRTSAPTSAPTPEPTPRPTPRPTRRPTPAPTPRPVRANTQLATLMRESFGETFRDVDVVRQIDGGWGVFVEFNAEDVLRMDWTRDAIESAMVDGYKALYTSGLDVRQASMTAWFPTVDNFGNDSEAIVHKTLLERREARQVNWEVAGTLDWGRIWTVSLMHPELRDAYGP